MVWSVGFVWLALPAMVCMVLYVTCCIFYRVGVCILVLYFVAYFELQCVVCIACVELHSRTEYGFYFPLCIALYCALDCVVYVVLYCVLYALYGLCGMGFILL